MDGAAVAGRDVAVGVDSRDGEGPPVAPAVVEDGKPVTARCTAGAAFTVMPLWVIHRAPPFDAIGDRQRLRAQAGKTPGSFRCRRSNPVSGGNTACVICCC